MFEKIEFTNKKISKEDLERILEAGILSPTAKSLQPQKIYVIESEKKLNKIKKITNYRSPTIILVCGDVEKCYKKNNLVSYKQDCILVSINMILEATYLGIDNLYMETYNFSNSLEKEFSLGINDMPVCLIFLGYKTEDSVGFRASDFNCNLLPKRKKNINEMVKYI